jgi:hypothetical protein
MKFFISKRFILSKLRFGSMGACSFRDPFAAQSVGHLSSRWSRVAPAALSRWIGRRTRLLMLVV